MKDDDKLNVLIVLMELNCFPSNNLLTLWCSKQRFCRLLWAAKKKSNNICAAIWHVLWQELQHGLQLSKMNGASWEQLLAAYLSSSHMLLYRRLYVMLHVFVCVILFALRASIWHYTSFYIHISSIYSAYRHDICLNLIKSNSAPACCMDKMLLALLFAGHSSSNKCLSHIQKL